MHTTHVESNRQLLVGFLASGFLPAIYAAMVTCGKLYRGAVHDTTPLVSQVPVLESMAPVQINDSLIMSRLENVLGSLRDSLALQQEFVGLERQRQRPNNTLLEKIAQVVLMITMALAIAAVNLMAQLAYRAAKFALLGTAKFVYYAIAYVVTAVTGYFAYNRQKNVKADLEDSKAQQTNLLPGNDITVDANELVRVVNNDTATSMLSRFVTARENYTRLTALTAAHDSNVDVAFSMCDTFTFTVASPR